MSYSVNDPEPREGMCSYCGCWHVNPTTVQFRPVVLVQGGDE